MRRAKRPAQQLSTASTACASARGSASTRAATSDTFQSRCHRLPSTRRRCRAGSDAAPTPSTTVRDERRPRSRSTDTAGRRSAHGGGPGAREGGLRVGARTMRVGAPELAFGCGDGGGGDGAEDIGGAAYRWEVTDKKKKDLVTGYGRALGRLHDWLGGLGCLDEQGQLSSFHLLKKNIHHFNEKLKHSHTV